MSIPNPFPNQESDSSSELFFSNASAKPADKPAISTKDFVSLVDLRIQIGKKYSLEDDCHAAEEFYAEVERRQGAEGMQFMRDLDRKAETYSHKKRTKEEWDELDKKIKDVLSPIYGEPVADQFIAQSHKQDEMRTLRETQGVTSNAMGKAFFALRTKGLQRKL